MGWKNEPGRHSLAAHGCKTGRKRSRGRYSADMRAHGIHLKFESGTDIDGGELLSGSPSFTESLYELAQAGKCEKELGSMDGPEWHGVLIDESFHFYVILHINSDGLCSYTQYETLHKMNVAWRKIEREFPVNRN